MVQNPHHYPWRHAPSLASRSLTGAGQPGGAPINTGKASPTMTGARHSDALYWAGSYVAPTDSKTPYTWDSVNNTDKTGSAILASSDETKTFTYSDDTISYSVTALGVTKKVTLERADIDVP